MQSENSAVTERRSASRSLAPATQQKFDCGLAFLESGRLEDAVAALEEAAGEAPGHARIRSHLGLAVARFEGDFERARELCESAAKQEFFNPELYLNMARVFLIFERRSEAMRYLRRGQMIDPGQEEIKGELQMLGLRRPPVVSFLPRRHPVNRHLGAVRSLIETSFQRRTAASSF